MAGGSPFLALGAALVLGAVLALPAPASADECAPVRPAAALAEARAAGRLVLDGAAAETLAEALRRHHVPIAAADYLILSAEESGEAAVDWIDEGSAEIAMQCGWTAAAGTPVAALIAAALAGPR